MIKVKELKDDAIVQIPVSKGYYMMAKNAAFTIINNLIKSGKSEEYLKEIGTKKYPELDDDQKAMQTITFLIAEIEAQATHQNLYVEQEVLEPGDEGYVAPTVD